MDDSKSPVAAAWVAQACTLPTGQQPLRLAEFDQLFATLVRSVERVDRLRLRLELTPEAAVASHVADLLIREGECCSFFTFTLTVANGRMTLDIAVPERLIEVLDSLTERAFAGAGLSD